MTLTKLKELKFAKRMDSMHQSNVPITNAICLYHEKTYQQKYWHEVVAGRRTLI